MLQAVTELAEELVEQVAGRWTMAVTNLPTVSVVVSCCRIGGRGGEHPDPATRWLNARYATASPSAVGKARSTLAGRILEIRCTGAFVNRIAVSRRSRHVMKVGVRHQSGKQIAAPRQFGSSDEWTWKCEFLG